MSTPFTLDIEDAIKIIKVVGWSAASAAVGSLIAHFQGVEATGQLAILIPTVNTVLYTLRRYIKNNAPDEAVIEE